MPVVRNRPDPIALGGVATGWLAAAIGVALALVVATLGQGLGALLGGCQWIGVSIPIHRPVWALVNQPTVAFASQPQALGYWLGSLMVPLALALALPPLLPRPRTLAGHLMLIQVTWACAVVAVAWLPLLDAEDGHLGRWLVLSDRPLAAAWLAPILAASAGLPLAVRLLSLARAVRPHRGRMWRLGVVVAHLGVPYAVWAGVVSALREELPIYATLGALVPLVLALGVAWVGYPAPYPHPLAPLGGRGRISWALLAVALAGTLWAAGRPLGGDRAAGLLWLQPGTSNNIRSWIVTSWLVQFDAEAGRDNR